MTDKSKDAAAAADKAAADKAAADKAAADKAAADKAAADKAAADKAAADKAVSDKPEPVVVRMLIDHGDYRCNDLAFLPDDEAENLIAEGLACDKPESVAFAKTLPQNKA